jgi:hypothetical protein
MGTIRSKVQIQGVTFYGVLAGVPTIGMADGSVPPPETPVEDTFFLYNDSAYPNGEIVDGDLVVDEEE